MNQWESNARIAATRKLCEMLDNNDALRQQCLSDPDKAKETLRQAGDFADIPPDLKVYIFENQVESSDKVVTLVLPKKGELPPADVFNAKNVWYCSWSHYLQ